MCRPAVCVYAILALSLTACDGGQSDALKCNPEGTFALVQEVFEARGCTASTCHGAEPGVTAGGLDLRSENAYQNLINIAASNAELPLVFPADEELSVLYHKVAAKTLGTDLAAFGIGGSPMPSSPDQLTEDEVELIRVWIRGGAPKTGIVAGTPAVGCDDLESAVPNKIPPPPAPDADKGIQFVSGGWSLPAESENEVCFVRYHDFNDRIPDRVRLPCPEAYGGPRYVSTTLRHSGLEFSEV